MEKSSEERKHKKGTGDWHIRKLGKSVTGDSENEGKTVSIIQRSSERSEKE